jgi:hypothetical protein
MAMSSNSSTYNVAAAPSTIALSATGRTLWSDIDAEEEAAMNANEAAATSADTLTASIARTTFRTTPVSVREMSNMRHKTFMFHPLDTMARLRALIFSKFGIPSASQGLFFRGAIIGDSDNTLFSTHLLGERLVHVVDTRVVEVRVVMLGGIANLQLQIPPSLLVSTLQSRICAATGFDPSKFRLSMGVFALMDDLPLLAYGVVGGRVDVFIHVRVRGGRMLPQDQADLNGWTPPQPVDVHVDEVEQDEAPLPDSPLTEYDMHEQEPSDWHFDLIAEMEAENPLTATDLELRAASINERLAMMQVNLPVVAPAFPPSPVDDPIEQFTTDDESVEDDDLLSVVESETDSTASANSLAGFSEEEDCMFNHRGLRWNMLMASFVAPNQPIPSEPSDDEDSQATTLHYVLSPEPAPEQVVYSPPTATAVIDCDDEVELLGQALKRQRFGDPEEGFYIFIKTLSGSTLILWVENADTIETVKRQILCTLRWIFSQPRDLILVIDGIQLGDARTLLECGITAGTQLTLIMRIRGGAGMDNADDEDPFDELDSSMPEVAGK